MKHLNDHWIAEAYEELGLRADSSIPPADKLRDLGTFTTKHRVHRDMPPKMNIIWHHEKLDSRRTKTKHVFGISERPRLIEFVDATGAVARVSSGLRSLATCRTLGPALKSSANALHEVMWCDEPSASAAALPVSLLRPFILPIDRLLRLLRKVDNRHLPFLPVAQDHRRGFLIERQQAKPELL